MLFGHDNDIYLISYVVFPVNSAAWTAFPCKQAGQRCPQTQKVPPDAPAIANESRLGLTMYLVRYRTVCTNSLPWAAQPPCMDAAVRVLRVHRMPFRIEQSMIARIQYGVVNVCTISMWLLSYNSHVQHCRLCGRAFVGNQCVFFLSIYSSQFMHHNHHTDAIWPRQCHSFISNSVFRAIPRNGPRPNAWKWHCANYMPTECRRIHDNYNTSSIWC